MPRDVERYTGRHVHKYTRVGKINFTVCERWSSKPNEAIPILRDETLGRPQDFNNPSPLSLAAVNIIAIYFSVAVVIFAVPAYFNYAWVYC